MAVSQVLEFSGVTKKFGSVTALSDVSTRIEPASVTGFVGLNGAGKSTLLRILLGQVRPTSGSATIGGVPYARLKHPLRAIGAVLESAGFHPAHTATQHMKIIARAAGIGRQRVNECLELVGLSDVASEKVRDFSQGMRQRLSLGTALLGDPGIVVLDEPGTALDPDGIRWMRSLITNLADEGRTVLMSSHMLGEVQHIADNLLILDQGELVYDGPLAPLVGSDVDTTVVDSPNPEGLLEALSAYRVDYAPLRSGFSVPNVKPSAVGMVAAAAGVPLSSLHTIETNLEQSFLDIVDGTVPAPSVGGEDATEDDDERDDDSAPPEHDTSDLSSRTAESADDTVAIPAPEEPASGYATGDSAHHDGGEAR